MNNSNFYDVTKCDFGNPYEDIGKVINDIIAEVKVKQAKSCSNGNGKPGAVIYLPPADYHLKTQVVIDISFLKIVGSGHGFTSSSIRFNVPKKDWSNLHELWPGGSRIINDLPVDSTSSEKTGAAFLVERDGDPRISSVEFSNFNIDGLHFVDDGANDDNPENSYVNNKTGIYVASAQDSFRITGMGFIYLEHGIVVYHADALTIHNNFIAECGNCIELRGWGQASKVTDNLMGAGYKGYSIYAQNFAQLLVSTNNIFPRGASTIYFEQVTRSLLSNNILHAFYPGMVVLKKVSSENLISSNHFLRDHEPWQPMQTHDNGIVDSYGLLAIDGNNNTVTNNHFSEIIDKKYLKPSGVTPVIIHVVDGSSNYISNNNVVASEAHSEIGESAFKSQVGALLTTQQSSVIQTINVLIEKNSRNNTILDSGTDEQILLDKSVNAIRFTPKVPNGEKIL